MAVRLPGRRSLATASRLGFTALVAVPVLVHASAFAAESWAWRLGSGAGAIRAHCGSCHEPDRARDFARSPAGWARTVDGMLRQRGPRPGSATADRDAVVGWLVRHRSADGATLFRHRCGRCHERTAVEPYRVLGEGALDLLVRQHTRQQNHAVQAWEGEAISQHIRDTGDVPRGALDPVQSLEFQRACGTCHSTSFLYRAICDPPRGEEAWAVGVARMQRKSPGLFERARIEALARHSAEVCESPLATR